jgi:hypothetical protein
MAINIAADAFGNALGQEFAQSMVPGSGPADFDDWELGQAMRANASRVTPAAGYTSVGGQIFDQLAQAFGEDSGPVTYGDKFAMDADRVVARDLAIQSDRTLRELHVNPRTGKPSFAVTSWAESEAEQALFGGSLINRPSDSASAVGSRSFYTSPGGTAFGYPYLAGASREPLWSGSRDSDRTTAGSLGNYLSAADSSV